MNKEEKIRHDAVACHLVCILATYGVCNFGPPRLKNYLPPQEIFKKQCFNWFFYSSLNPQEQKFPSSTTRLCKIFLVLFASLIHLIN